MENDKAIEILRKMLEKPSLDAEEKEAVMTALGMLGWVKLSKSRMKLIKEKRDQSLKWQ
ncbi:hypothetical protein [Dehalogenimonas etheniformans]|uniref:hypothetical protein n=1 Tax=Dehalogenimonas etheniformans TaxID=1536648 RepID=UPI0013923D9B|nr:hypothetical protein [Dehalogenimonas etheniformans]QNT76926.1 hypothetical protein HX448_09695 [Dehalogenimonas etheniformans]